MNESRVDVLVIGGGPSGLAMAIELKRLGLDDVVVVDREDSFGGIPRHTHHSGYGVRDLRRIMSGPTYANHYITEAERRGVRLASGTTVYALRDDGRVLSTSGAGMTMWIPKAVVLATGCRERPRPARLVAGRRGAGIFTTGSLQQMADIYGLPIGSRAVVVGAEHVSFSAVHTLTRHGVRVVAMVTKYPTIQSFRALQMVTSSRIRAHVFAGHELVDIVGNYRINGVVIEDCKTGERHVVECDTVVFTGDWVPDNELARTANIQLDHATRGPSVDQDFRTSQRGVFAVGNLVHPAESADVAALTSRRVARSVGRFLQSGGWPKTHLMLTVEPPLRWVEPSRISSTSVSLSRRKLYLRSDEFAGDGYLELWQGDKLIDRARKGGLVPNRSIVFRSRLAAVRMDRGPLHIRFIH